jgi:hypothetical protein
LIVKIRRAKKGIAEYVAVLLLIIITVAGTIILYVYSSGLMGSLQGAQPQKPYAQMITVEYYDWTTTASGTSDPTLHHLQIIIRNVGSGIAVLSEFFVSGVKITTPITGTCTTYTSTTKGLPPQGSNSCTAILTIPNTGVTQTITSGIAYPVKVVTGDGSVFAYSLVAGRSTGML